MRKGITLLEVMLAVGITVIITAVMLVLIDPGGQMSKTRNTQRISHITGIMNAIVSNMSDNRGSFSCASGDIPASATRMTAATSGYNIAPCLVPVYESLLPFDPSLSGAHYSSSSDYDTGYEISKNASTGRITITAPGAELGQTISITR